MTIIPISINEWADFWRYRIGVNVIPANTREKVTWIKWAEYQNKPIPEWQHERWKQENVFSDGMAIIVGKVWHNQSKKNLYLIFVDLDNQKAIEEFCTRNGKNIPLQNFAEHMIIEKHKDQPNRAHAYFYANHPFRKKSSDRVGNLSSKIDNNEIPAIEVKGSGEHGIAFCAPSPTKNGCREIIGTHDPEVFDDVDDHIDTILRKYDIQYLDSVKDKIPIEDLFNEDTKIYEGHNRHEALLRVMESLLRRNRNILKSSKIMELAEDWNKHHCQPPLEKREIENQWKSALRFIEEQNKRRAYEQQQRDGAGREAYEEMQDSEQRKREQKLPLSI
ncbi:MAG TPA: primase alpha helix C-terminal domain-containing protein, partial [Nitrososphaeraceae archaeon]